MPTLFVLLLFVEGGGGVGVEERLPHELVRSLSQQSFRRSERFNLSSSRLWNLLRLDCEPFFGGDDDILLHGLCIRLVCELRDEAREYCRDIFAGTLRCAGEPTIKSAPGGDVDRLGPSDLHSDTFLERHDVPLLHSDTRRERLDL